jgi:hypothetical protein
VFPATWLLVAKVVGTFQTWGENCALHRRGTIFIHTSVGATPPCEDKLARPM